MLFNTIQKANAVEIWLYQIRMYIFSQNPMLLENTHIENITTLELHTVNQNWYFMGWHKNYKQKYLAPISKIVSEISKYRKLYLKVQWWRIWIAKLNAFIISITKLHWKFHYKFQCISNFNRKIRWLAIIIVKKL